MQKLFIKVPEEKENFVIELCKNFNVTIEEFRPGIEKIIIAYATKEAFPQFYKILLKENIQVGFFHEESPAERADTFSTYKELSLSFLLGTLSSAFIWFSFFLNLEYLILAGIIISPISLFIYQLAEISAGKPGLYLKPLLHFTITSLSILATSFFLSFVFEYNLLQIFNLTKFILILSLVAGITLGLLYNFNKVNNIITNIIAGTILTPGLSIAGMYFYNKNFSTGTDMILIVFSHLLSINICIAAIIKFNITTNLLRFTITSAVSILTIAAFVKFYNFRSTQKTTTDQISGIVKQTAEKMDEIKVLDIHTYTVNDDDTSEQIIVCSIDVINRKYDRASKDFTLYTDNLIRDALIENAQLELNSLGISDRIIFQVNFLVQ
ncbi:MAG: hypothetical protein ACK40G_07110 [Cytophagaceae bacterium]